MPLRFIAILLGLAGVAMIVVGISSKRFFATQSFWTEQQAKEYVDASAALKLAATGSIRPPSPTSDPKLAAAHERFNRIQADLDWAITRRNYTGMVLGAGGAILLVAGVALFLRGQTSDKESSTKDRTFIRR